MSLGMSRPVVRGIDLGISKSPPLGVRLGGFLGDYQRGGSRLPDLNEARWKQDHTVEGGTFNI